MRYELETGYSEAEEFARSHYENFPVISFLLKQDLRKHVAVIYWFARTADDIADEGNMSDDYKVEELNLFRDSFTNILLGDISSPVEAALLHTIKEKNLNPQLFYDLISAFKQDLIKNRYNNFDEVLDYCSRSANPIGRLLLELHNVNDPEALVYSDKICTALQLINFCQDIDEDFQRGRLYLPLDEMEIYFVEETQFDLKQNNINLERLVKHNLDRADNMLMEGKKLLAFLPLPLRYEIKWTILGGKKIIDKIRKNKYNVFVRPKLSRFDFIKLLFQSFV